MIPKERYKEFQNLIRIWDEGLIKFIDHKLVRRRKYYIGKGGFGTVYPGKYKSLDVAIKQMDIPYDDFIHTIKNEIEIMAEIGQNKEVLKYFV